MLKRQRQIKFRLTDEEAEYLERRITKSGLSRTAYFCQLIHDLVPTDVPPPDYFKMMGELRKIGVNLNQIAQKAHVLGVIDTQPYFAAVDALNKAVIEITKAVMRPRKFDRRE